jgi:cell division protein FtsB
MNDSGAVTPDAPVRPTGRRQLRSRQDIRERRRRFITYSLLAGSAILVVDALVGENGYLAKLRGHREQAALKVQLEQVQDENRRLEDLIYRLRHDPNTLDEAARRELHLMAPGEIMVQIKDQTPPAAGR